MKHFADITAHLM